MKKRFPIMPEEEPLIHAAIQLSDWLLQQKSVSEDKKKTVKAVQSALKTLPYGIPDFEGAYGFSANGLFPELCRENPWIKGARDRPEQTRVFSSNKSG